MSQGPNGWSRFLSGTGLKKSSTNAPSAYPGGKLGPYSRQNPDSVIDNPFHRPASSASSFTSSSTLQSTNPSGSKEKQGVYPDHNPYLHPDNTHSRHSNLSNRSDPTTNNNNFSNNSHNSHNSHSNHNNNNLNNLNYSLETPHPPSNAHSDGSSMVSGPRHDDLLDDNEGECPVCLEPLSFSFRLPGEKPHVVPECGHALHEACFSAVYGPVPGSRPGLPRKSSLGVCGVCRRPMKVSDGDSGKSNKLAALTGMGDRSNPSGATRSNTMGGRSMGPGSSTPSSASVQDPNEDDPIERTPHSHASSPQSPYQQQQSVVSPSITVRSEFSTITRNGQNVQPHTCLVIVELPSKRSPDAGVGAGVDAYRSIVPTALGNLPTQALSPISGPGSRRESPDESQLLAQNQAYQQNHQLGRKPSVESGGYGYDNQNGYGTNQYSQYGGGGGNGNGGGGNDRYNSGLTASSMSSGQMTEQQSGAFQSITEDLRNRVTDWKGHPMSGLGPLQMFDILSVRRDVLVREFYVYLFKEAIICVLEEKKKSLGSRLLSPTGSDAASVAGSTSSNKGILRLKGRIYIRHIKQVHDTSSAGELSLTIDMEDERLESFILIFRDRATLESWKGNISTLVQNFQQSMVGQAGRPPGGDGLGLGPGTNLSAGNGNGNGNGGGGGSRLGHGEMDDFGSPGYDSQGGTLKSSGTLPKGISPKAARMLSGGTNAGATDGNNMDSLINASRGTGTNVSGYNNYGTGNTMSRLAQMPSEEHLDYGVSEQRTVTPHVASNASNSLQPIVHPALDLILIISVPPSSASSPAYSPMNVPSISPATAQLKVRVIKNTLDFVVAQLNPRDRLSIVTFEVGVGGKVRKTPFLMIGKQHSRARLEKFVEGILGPEDDLNGGGGGGHEGGAHGGGPHGHGGRREEDDEFLVRNANEEKTDVVTAVNHGLDVVLQRKSKNSVSGMVLVSDASDSTRRAQMDLVLARAEAANVPIHSFGYGRSHDPASLWLISNHTSGTYTFVKDWYDLRDCLAGCLGGIMSIGLLNMKLHMKIVDANRFRIRKVSGGPNAIVAQDGKDVHVEIGELRYGERKEMLVELELDNNLDMMRMNAMGMGAMGNMGNMNGMNGMAGMNGMGGGMGGMNGGGVDPASGRMMNATDAFVARMGLDISGDSPNLMDGMMDRMIDEVPVFEVDGSYHDPVAGRQVGRLSHPVLLTVTLLPVTARQPNTPNQAPASDALIIRRRMELLASDMMTRALVLVSRKNYAQAQRILAETKRILHTVLQNISHSLPPPTINTNLNQMGNMGNMGQMGRAGTPTQASSLASAGSGNGSGFMGARNRRELVILQAVRALQAILQDLQYLTDALDENVDMFAHDQRNFGAQQAMILRDQKSWSKRSAVEKLFWTVDNSIELVGRSVDWVGRD